MKNNAVNLTAAEEVLLAAVKIISKGKKEFTEWDLTIETWGLNKNRWGLRGYEEKYPDHKRVMNEVMAGGTQKVVGRGWLERVRPNYYKVTNSGLAKAQSLSGIELKKGTRSLYEYDALLPDIQNKIFETYCKDEKEPKTWLGAAAFLKLKKYDAQSLDRRLKSIKESILNAKIWMEKNKTQILTRSDSTKPITKSILKKLEEFLEILEKRFKDQFEAIRKQK